MARCDTCRDDFMKLFAALTVPLSLLVAQTGSAPLTVTAVRHWSIGDVTRVAIEVSGDFQYHSDRLHNPERIYFDILNSKPRIDKKPFFLESIDDKLLQRLRIAETVPGTTRIVLDLGTGVQVTTSQLPNPNRLMIEMRAMGAAPVPTEPPPPMPAVAPTKPLPAPPAIVPSITPLKPPAVIKTDVAAEPVTAEPAKSQLSESAEPPAASTPAVTPPAAAPVSKPAPAASAPFDEAKAARHTSTGETSLVRALGLKLNRIVIDPGHGGHDEGTHGAHGLIEKELVLDVALRLGKLIEQHMDAEVVFTRRDDTFIPLEGRTTLANEKKADLFLSIHANSSPVPRITGVETYYLNFPSSTDAADVASRENATSDKSIFELRDLVQKITLHDKSEESKEFAGRIQASLYAFSSRNFPGEYNRGVKKAPFVVLIGASMPSILAEIGFLTNTREEALLKKPDYRQKLAEALYGGIAKYADSLSHFRLAQTGNPAQ